MWKGISHLVARLEVAVPDELVTSAALFQVWRVETAYSLSVADQRYIREHGRTGPQLKNADTGVRHFREISLTRAHVKPGQISSLDAELPVYLVAREEAAAWKLEGLSGLAFGPVHRHTGMKDHDGAALVVPESVLGPITIGPNTIHESFTANDLVGHHQLSLGFLIYGSQAISEACDLNLTREPICSYGYPQVVVSRRFVDFYVRRKLRGWKFRPILEEGSKWHREFGNLFSAFIFDWKSGSLENRFSGP